MWGVGVCDGSGVREVRTGKETIGVHVRRGEGGKVKAVTIDARDLGAHPPLLVVNN